MFLGRVGVVVNTGCSSVRAWRVDMWKRMSWGARGKASLSRPAPKTETRGLSFADAEEMQTQVQVFQADEQGALDSKEERGSIPVKSMQTMMSSY